MKYIQASGQLYLRYPTFRARYLALENIHQDKDVQWVSLYGCDLIGTEIYTSGNISEICYARKHVASFDIVGSKKTRIVDIGPAHHVL